MAAQISSLRPAVSQHQIELGIKSLTEKLFTRLLQKGYGAYASRHEILGILEEEMLEVKEAIRLDTPEGYAEFAKELLDVAVGAIFGYMSMVQHIIPVSNHD